MVVPGPSGIVLLWMPPGAPPPLVLFPARPLPRLFRHNCVFGFGVEGLGFGVWGAGEQGAGLRVLG